MLSEDVNKSCGCVSASPADCNGVLESLYCIVTVSLLSNQFKGIGTDIVQVPSDDLVKQLLSSCDDPRVTIPTTEVLTACTLPASSLICTTSCTLGQSCQTIALTRIAVTLTAGRREGDTVWTADRGPRPTLTRLLSNGLLPIGYPY